MQQTSWDGHGRLGINPNETIVLIKDTCNTYVPYRKFQVMAIKEESQKRQKSSSQTKPYEQKMHDRKDTKLSAVKSTFNNRNLRTDIKLVKTENSWRYMATAAL